MMKWFLSLFLIPLAALSAEAQSVKLPPTLLVPSPGLVIIVPESIDADDIAWMPMDAGLQLIPGNLLKSNLTAVGFASQPGTYRVRAIAAKSKDGKAVLSPVSECVITIGGAPTPPVPPTPPPTPPGPVDPLTQQFQSAYDAEPDKAKRVSQLATFTQGMSNAASLVNAKKPDGSFVVVSAKQLADAVHLAAETDVGKMNDGALAQVRKAVGVYLNSRIPPKDQPLDGAERAVVTDAYGKVAAALKGVK